MEVELLKELLKETQLYLDMQNHPENYKVIEIHNQKRKLSSITDKARKYLALNKF